jgi:putative tryptophan/tyrosine transport system substrate-binding protein
MRLIGLVLALVSNLFALLATDAYGQASQPKPSAGIPTVGVLYPGVSDPAITGRRFSVVFALQEGLRELGYVDGQNIVLMHRWASGKSEMLPDLAADLVRLKVDVLFAVGSQAIRAAMAASRTIPIVATDLESDPVEGGYVASFARPGGNVTGLFLDLPGLTGKWLQLVKEVSPQTRRVAVLWDATTSLHQLHALKAAAKAATIELRILEVRRPAEYEDALLAAIRGRAQALVQLSSPLIRQASRRVAEFTVKNRLLAISMFREFPEGGGLMAYGPDLLFLRRAATYVDISKHAGRVKSERVLG